MYITDVHIAGIPVGFTTHHEFVLMSLHDGSLMGIIASSHV